MDEREIYWIEFYNTTDGKYGYNIESGGAGACSLYSMSKSRIIKKCKKENISPVCIDCDRSCKQFYDTVFFCPIYEQSFEEEIN